ncbi:hypothetical protein ACKI2N_015615 [Cupriavidus sp. 30B13]|uniref:hypothetical protein n=1 Tax=Cupriavidus sp. 30B13 TaxID=3384241 RepID=UPI003B903821
MTETINSETVNRTLKQLVDSGRAKTFEEAEAILDGYRLQLHIDANHARLQHGQIAALTAVELARRVFLGGVYVSVELDAPAHPCIGHTGTLVDALLQAGAKIGTPGQTPVVSIGETTGVLASGFHVRLVTCGWRAGIAPASDHPGEVKGYVMPLASVAAAALAVGEAFLSVSGISPLAGRRTLGISLWDPATPAWASAASDGPPLTYLPSDIWMLGLGHLGQAYAWCLGMLPYDTSATSKARVIVQDTDSVSKSTESTSVVSRQTDVGRPKTRVVASWLEERGFSTRLVERLFEGDTRRGKSDPGVLLCGVDNPVARRLLDTVGFPFIVEAGLGSRFDDFQCARIHTFPGSRAAVDVWPLRQERAKEAPNGAYDALLREGRLDQCGVTTLAGKAVGAAFVGVFTAALAMSELLRVLHGGHAHDVIDINLFDLEYRSVVPNRTDFASLNSGFVAAA